MAGRKPFVPTQEQRDLVRELAGFGIPHPDICRLVVNPQTGAPIDAKTLRLNFRAELDAGEVTANHKVAGALFKNATTATDTYPGGNPTAQIFWLKTRAGWKERTVLEHDYTRPDDRPARELTDAELEAELERLGQEEHGQTTTAKPRGAPKASASSRAKKAPAGKTGAGKGTRARKGNT